MNSIKVLEKPLNLKYSHSVGENKTILDGTLVFDSANKLSVNHKLGSEGCKLKYSYVHGGLTTFEPSYDTQEDSWDFAVSHGKDVCSATYKTSSKNLGLQWSRSSKLGASFKVQLFCCLSYIIDIDMNKVEWIKMIYITHSGKVCVYSNLLRPHLVGLISIFLVALFK